MKLRLIAILALTASILSGCGKPVPADKAAYVGEWEAPHVMLVIMQRGRVVYRRSLGDGFHESIKAPIERFEGDNFVVGLGPIKTTFVVSAPPHKEGSIWKMTVDGVELTKAGRW